MAPQVSLVTEESAASCVAQQPPLQNPEKDNFNIVFNQKVKMQM